MDKKQWRVLITETLKEIDLYSEDSVNLLMGTAAQESRFKYIQQLGGGPAKGYFQMEPATYRDHMQWLVRYKKKLSGKILKVSGVENYDANYLYSAVHAICMARIHYLRKPTVLPDNLEGYAYYYKKHYNTYLGKATTKEFIHNYKKYVL